MSEWEEVEEDGQKLWINEDLGNVFKVSVDGQDKYVAMFPRVIKLGFFKTAQDAMNAVSGCQEKLTQQIELLNEEFTK